MVPTSINCNLNYYICSRFEAIYVSRLFFISLAHESSYIAPSHLAFIPDLREIAAAAFYQAKTLLVKNKLHTSKLKKQELNLSTTQQVNCPHPDGIVRDEDLDVYFLSCFSYCHVCLVTL